MKRCSTASNRDKKHKQDSYMLILAEPDGGVVLKKIAKSAESKDRVEKPIRSVVESYAS